MTNTIIQVSLPSGNYLFVKVPKNASNIRIATDNEGFIRLWYGLPIIRGMFQIELPPGHTYSIIGLAKDLTDEQWGKIVEKERDFLGFDGYKNYDPDCTILETNMDSVIKSGHSLVIREGFIPEECLIIKID